MFDPRLIPAWLASRRPYFRDRDRGDVPGWVMVTVMTAILVVAILGVFKSQITNAVTHAIDSVSGNN
jgi:type VI protein secretion system component VasF